MNNRLTRRSLILGGLGVTGAGALAACAGGQPTAPKVFGSPSSVPASAGQRVTTARLVARPTTLDLGGPTVMTWAYGDSVPGPLIRARAGDLVRVTLENELPAETTIHWHGIALRNAADGVPGLTQDPIKPRTSYTYEFTAPDPGTYFYHPHVGVQLDRGLYAALIVDDPAEPGAYDHEFVVVLDDWVDGTGRTPDDVLKELIAKGGSATDGMGGMGAMDHGSMGGAGTAPFGDAGDVVYPHYLVNGKVPADPDVLEAKPGQKVRLRVINAASDTIFTVALAGHRLTVTHSDGFPVRPTETGAFYIGMGERYDAVVTLQDGAFPLVAVPFGKQGQAVALVRTGAGSAPPASVRPAELSGPVLLGTSLVAAEAARLPRRAVDATAPVQMVGQMTPYRWGINGARFGENDPIVIGKGQRVRLDVANMTMMAHPFHLHGHTFGLLEGGLRKDTVLLRPMERIAVELDAENAGEWAAHCHNIYHAEAGMMIALRYRA